MKRTVEQNGCSDSSPSNSVKDLEHAMSKHLPSNILGKTSTSKINVLHQPTDFSTDTLLKQQQQRSTIQWIGAHHHHLNHLSHQQHLQHHSQIPTSPGTAPLPATALLRQLYANRESVIRANVSSVGRTSSSAGWSDVPQLGGPLPTPPGSSEGSSTTYAEQFLLQKQSGSGQPNDAFTSLISTYNNNGPPVPVCSGYTMDYHSAMTPPSSVSPRDKHQQLHGSQVFDHPSYSEVLRAHQYGVGVGESPAQPLPLKPQVYSAMHSSLDTPYGPVDQSQFYHHGSSSGGFHLYHPTATSKSQAPSNWYPTSSS